MVVVMVVGEGILPLRRTRAVIGQIAYYLSVIRYRAVRSKCLHLRGSDNDSDRLM